MARRASFPCVASVVLALGLHTLACQPAQSPPEAGEPAASAETPGAADGGELAAEINGVPITLAELDGFIKEELFRGRATSPPALTCTR